MNKISLILIALAATAGMINFFFSPVHAVTTILIPHNNSTMYYKGFANGTAIADDYYHRFAPRGPINATDVDCDSDINPLEANPDYCDGSSNGFAFETNRLSGK
jgi:hypothetical protein